MDFALMFCPYCGRTVDSSDPDRYVCQSCGKIINSKRTDVYAFIRPSEIEDRFREAMDAMADDNSKKAMTIANDLVENTGCCNHDAYFLRGYILAEEGEDGKALADWKKGLELLSNDINLDSYICLMCKAVSDMILFKEKEFIEFNVIAHIDKLSDEVDSSTGMSCRAFVYYTVYRDCLDLIRTQDGEESNELRDVIPDLFRRIVAYHRDYWCLPRIIDEYLDLIGYNPDTFEEDDDIVPHIYDLINHEFKEHISKMTDEDRIRLFDRWDDRSLKENIEPILDGMVKPKGLLSKIRKKDDPGSSDIEATVHSYVDKCLLIDGPAEEPINNPEKSETETQN